MSTNVAGGLCGKCIVPRHSRVAAATTATAASIAAAAQRSVMLTERGVGLELGVLSEARTSQGSYCW